MMRHSVTATLRESSRAVPRRQMAGDFLALVDAPAIMAERRSWEFWIE
jgi:hypothetical protein